MFIKIQKRDSREIVIDSSKITEAIGRAALAVCGNAVSSLSSLVEEILGLVSEENTCPESSSKNTSKNSYSLYLRSVFDVITETICIFKMIILNIKRFSLTNIWTRHIPIFAGFLINRWKGGKYFDVWHCNSHTS